MIFDTSAMSCCGKKSINIVPTSFQKQPSNQHPNLNRFWSQPGSILGGFRGSKLGPSWHQIAPKIDLKTNHKNDHLSDRSWNRFWSIFGPKMGPKRGPQKSLFEVLGALGAILGPRWPQDPSKDKYSPLVVTIAWFGCVGWLVGTLGRLVGLVCWSGLVLLIGWLAHFVGWSGWFVGWVGCLGWMARLVWLVWLACWLFGCFDWLVGSDVFVVWCD